MLRILPSLAGVNLMNGKVLFPIAFGVAAILLTGCTSSSTVRTSASSAIVQTSAAPVCGGTGAMRAAQKQAAIETIKAGFDRYIITGAASSNNVRVTQGPGTYYTSGTVTGGYYSGTTTYRPGMPIVSGSHNQAFAIHMFRDGEPGANEAISARETLGPKWPELVKKGSINTCAS